MPGGRKPLDINACHAEAVARNGRCLSDVYVKATTKYEWECNRGHKWKATLRDVRHGNTWCPFCAGNIPLTVEICHDIAKDNEGKFLSQNYKNAYEFYEWECKYGHKWTANLICIKYKNAWCPHCAGNAPLTIELCHEVAKKRGGEFLSSEYINNAAIYEWKCGEGHTFNASLANVKDKASWCPYCLYKSESACRTILTELLGEKFDKCRPKCLQKLELDGFSQKLGLAFEYNGRQHEEFTPFFHASKDDFNQQIDRDNKKDILCIENDIYLLRIPSRYSHRDMSKLREFIVNELKYAGYID